MSTEKFIDGLNEAARAADIRGYMQERHDLLTAQTSPITYIGTGEKISYRYIHPESVVKVGALTKGFRVNDPAVHDKFADAVIVISRLGEIQSPEEIILHSAQWATLLYLGQNEDNRKLRKKVQGGLIRGRVRDLSEVADSNTAMCVEKAVVSHNLCMLGAVASAYLTGDILIDNQEPLGHAFQLVQVGKKNMLFDPTSPSYNYINGRLSMIPTPFEIDSTEFLIEGKPVTTTKLDNINKDVPCRTFTYTHQPLYPVTFEGFDSLSFIERAALGETPKESLRYRAIKDAARNLLSSGLIVELE
jgi:hypothetical protein